METIESISELIQELCKGKGDNNSYLPILKRVKLSPNAYKDQVCGDKDKYGRCCIYKNDDFELVLVCFEKGQGSPIHDYDAHNAWITVLKGKLREEKYAIPLRGGPLEKVSSVNLSLGDFSFISGSVGIHRYYNIFDSHSVCLCLFSKPVSHWKVYNESDGKCQMQNTWYSNV